MTDKARKLKTVVVFTLVAAGLFAGWVAMEYGIVRLLVGLVTLLKR